jgi:hypothetical protein
MDASPYTPPRHLSDSFMMPTTRALDTLCFLINFAISTFFLIACVVSIGAADNPFAFIGGLVFALPSTCYAIAEWMCWYRRRHWLFRSLGILNLLFAAFVAFGLITNLGEALLANEPVNPLFILLFGLGFTVFAGYLRWCGWRRIRAIPAATDLLQEVG